MGFDRHSDKHLYPAEIKIKIDYLSAYFNRMRIFFIRTVDKMNYILILAK